MRFKRMYILYQFVQCGLQRHGVTLQNRCSFVQGSIFMKNTASTLFRFLFLVVVLATFTACEKTIQVNLSEGKKQLVVEGVIESGEMPYVLLTRSIGFFDKIDFNKVDFVKGAQVRVNDLTSGKSVALKEFSIDSVVGGQTFSFTVYIPDFNDPNALTFKGEFGHQYQLNIDYNNETFSAVTQIPKSTGLDSLWLEPVQGKEQEYAILRARYADPDTLGNCVKIQTKRQKMVKDGFPEDYFSPFNDVYDDNIINGLKVNITVDLGFDRNREYSTEEFQYLPYVKKGDTVTVKWSAIDRSVYRFWETLAFAEGSVGNPFASPTKVQSNVSNKAVGVWAGYGNYYFTIIDSL